MKVSEAIRAGSKIRPQTFGEFFSDGGSCALGAALEGAGIYDYEDKDDIMSWVIQDQWPELRQLGKCPVACGVEEFQHEEFQIVNLIVHLNDDHRLTREWIADWLEKMGL